MFIIAPLIVMLPFLIVWLIFKAAGSSARRHTAKSARRASQRNLQAAMADSRYVPQASTVTQSLASAVGEEYAHLYLMRRNKMYRKDAGVLTAGDAAIVGFAEYISRTALPGLDVPEVKVVGRHTSGGSTALASFKFLKDGTPIITVTRKNATPIVLMHELAHYAAESHAPGAYHGEVWIEAYSKIVATIYGQKAAETFVRMAT